MKNWGKILLMNTMIIGVMVILSSNNWVMIWIGVELTMISFLPLMINKMMISSESIMKYFLVQSISSSILILGLMVMMIGVNFSYEMLIMLAITIKTGMSPFHNWILIIIDGLNYYSMFILLTIMKIGPISILSYTNLSTIFILMSMISGCLLALNQSSLKKILSYSSIFNMGVITMTVKNNFMWMTYLFIYSLILIMILYLLDKLNINYLNQISVNEFSLTNKMWMWTMMLTMSGFPPSIGFFIKIMVLESIYESQLMTITLIITSLITMFFYIRVSYLSVMLFSISKKWMIKNLFNSPILLLTISCLPLVLMLKQFN